MLSEEALVLFTAAGACVLLVLGILELVAPTRPRHRRRRTPPARDPWRRARTGPPVVRREDAPAWPSTAPAAPPVETEPPIERMLISDAASVAPVAPAAAPDATAAVVVEDREPAAAAPAVEDVEPRPAAVQWVAMSPEPARSPLEPPPATGSRSEPAPVAPARSEPGPETPVPAAAGEERADRQAGALAERCYALYEAHEFREVIAEAVPALDSASSGALFLDPRDVARLWGVVGLARQALGEHDAARAAFEEAISVAPDFERATWQRHLAALALHVGQHMLAQVQNATVEGEDRVTTLHAALTWLEGGLAAVPDDETLREAAAAARATLWPTYGQVTGELVQRQEFQAARRLLRQALADESCPAKTQHLFRDLLATTYSGEVGQLTAEAIRRMQEGKEDEALATLDRAEKLLTTIPEEGLADKRRQELERRLWWSYTKVGLRRLDGGLYEEALAPLLHALHFGSVGPERLDETKRPLVRALESIVETRSPLIQRLATDGDRDGALVLCEKLWSFLEDAMDGGLTRDELAAALNRTQALFDKLGKRRK